MYVRSQNYYGLSTVNCSVAMVNPNTTDRLLESHPAVSFLLISSFTFLCYTIVVFSFSDVNYTYLAQGTLVGLVVASIIIAIRTKTGA